MNIFESDIEINGMYGLINSYNIKRLYKYSWEARKIVNIPVNDSLRLSPVISGIEENNLNILNDELKRLNFLQKLRRALILERRDGGCAFFVGYEGEKNLVSAPNRAKRIDFLNIVEIDKLEKNFNTQSPDDIILKDLENIDYSISKKQINKERLIVLRGVFPKFEADLTNTKVGFSDSVLEPIFYDIYRAVSIRENVFKLSKKSNYMLMSVENLPSIAGDEGNIDSLKNLLKNLENNDCAIIDGSNFNLQEMNINFGALPELIQTYLKILASALDVPVTRFLGISNSGLTQSSDGDLENYYNLLGEYQENHIKPIIDKFVKIVCYSIFGTNFQEIKDIKIEFPPLWNQSDIEKQQINTSKLTNIVKAEESGLMLSSEAIKEINSSNIFTTELCDKDLSLDEDEDEI